MQITRFWIAVYSWRSIWAKNSIINRILNGVIWNMIGNIVSRGMPMIAAVFTARILGASGYGELAMISSTVGMFSTMSGLGMGLACTKSIAELRESNTQRIGELIALANIITFISGGLLSIFLFYSAEWLASSILGESKLKQLLQVATIILFCGTITGVQAGVLAGFEDFRSIAKIGMIQGLCYFPLILGAVFVWGVPGAVIALAINSIFVVILNQHTLNRLLKYHGVRLQYSSCWKEKGVFLSLSIPAMLTSMMIIPIVWYANSIIVNLSDGYKELGLFNAANQWRTFIEFIPGVIGSVLFPILNSNPTGREPILETVNIIAGWIVVCILALPLISFPEVIGVLYGSDYSNPKYFKSLVLVLFVSCLLSYKDGIARMLVTKNLMWWGVLSNMLWGGIFLGCLTILKQNGSVGLAFAYVIAYGLVTVAFVPFYIKKGIVPRRLLISVEIAIVWSVIILMSFLSFFNCTLVTRIISFIIGIYILTVQFGSIWKKRAM